MFRQTAANMRKDIGHRGSPHLFRKMKNSMVRKLKTSDFFEGNIRTFDAKHPYFQSKKSDVLQLPDRRLSPPKIFFPKISYTSYTRAPKPLFLQGISGEG